MARVSVIIVNYNSGPIVEQCVTAVFASTLPLKCLVVDNASQDNSMQILKDSYPSHPDLTLLYNKRNVGFSKGCNTALPHIDTEYVLFLNPDCFLQPQTIAQMLEIMDAQSDVGMAGCLLRNEDGSEQRGCRRRFPTPMSALMRLSGLNKLYAKKKLAFDLNEQPLPTDVEDIEAISGAFMFVRTLAIKKVGPLDESYRLHCEDLDWCKRFHQSCWRVIFVPHVEVAHLQGACSTRVPIFVIWHKHKGMWRFYRKFYREEYSWFLFLLVFVAIMTRSLALIGLTLASNLVTWLKKGIKSLHPETSRRAIK